MPGNSQGSDHDPVGAGACKAAPTHIYLSRSLPVKGLIAQAAHEFMHAIQYSYDSKSCVNEYHTTLEATAVWATNYVYRGITGNRRTRSTISRAALSGFIR